MAAPTPVVSFDVAFAEYQAWIGSSIHPVAPEQRGRPHKKQRIIVAGDFHCPHQIDEAVKKLIQNESRDTDLLVIDGDFMDLGSVSRWPKLTKQTAILDD